MEQKDDRTGLAACLGKLGETLIGLGRFDDAHAALLRARRIYEELGLTDASAFLEAIGGLALVHQGDFEQAHQWLERVLTHFQLARSRRGSAYSFLLLGWAALAHNATVQAQTYLEASLDLYRELGQQDELGQTHALLALVAHCHHRAGEAQTHLAQAQQIAETIQAFMPRLLAIGVMARIERDHGNAAQAAWLYRQIAHEPLVAASRWFTMHLSAENTILVSSAINPTSVDPPLRPGNQPDRLTGHLRNNH
jgi:tetratricopeptide (TPR) repeat protein